MVSKAKQERMEVCRIWPVTLKKFRWFWSGEGETEGDSLLQSSSVLEIDPRRNKVFVSLL